MFDQLFPFDFGANFGGSAAMPTAAPEALANFFATQGVPPAAFLNDPSVWNNQSWGNQTTGGFDPPAPGGAQSTLDSVMNDPTANGSNIMQRLAEALRGVKAPAAPTAPQLSTPSAPHPTGSVKGGELMALLQSLGGGGVGGKPAAPLSLRTAIGGR
jgi:hypothetical protein